MCKKTTMNTTRLEESVIILKYIFRLMVTLEIVVVVVVRIS